MNYVNATSNHMELDMNATSNDNLIEFNVLRNSVEDFDSEDQTNLRYQYNCFDDKPQEGHNILRRQHHIDDIVPQDFVISIIYLGEITGEEKYFDFAEKIYSDHYKD